MMSIFLLALVLATFVEGTIEYVLGRYEKAKPYLMYAALVAGMALAFAYKMDLIAQVVKVLNLEDITLAPAWVGYIVSGVIIGRGSNYLNDFITGFVKNRVIVSAPAVPPAPSE